MNYLESTQGVFRTCIKLPPIALSLLIVLACSSDDPSPTPAAEITTRIAESPAQPTQESGEIYEFHG